MASPELDPHALLADAVHDPAISETPQIRATSEIVEVTVYGRGAMVTREIHLDGDVPAGSFDLVVEDVTVLAHAGSFRVNGPEGGRHVVSVDTSIRLPSSVQPAGEGTERLKQIDARIADLEAERGFVTRRAESFRRLVLKPRSRPALRELGPKSRVESAFGLADTVTDRVAMLDTQASEFSEQILELRQERQAVRLELGQSSASERQGPSHPTRKVRVRFGAGEGDVGSTRFSYAIPYAARWWPVYSLQLSDGGQRAALVVEALVAQRTGEDWSHVKLGLSTSELIFDATLPTLPSLRLGKAQPPVASGYTEPPQGVERLFESFDKAFASGDAADTNEMAAVNAVSYQQKPSGQVQEDWDDDGDGDLLMMMDEAAAPPMPSQAPMSSLSAMPPPSRSMAMQQRPSPPRAKKAKRDSRTRSSAPMKGSFGAGGMAPPEPEPEDLGINVDDMWLDFDSLALASPVGPQRGRLKKRGHESHHQDTSMAAAEVTAQGMKASDPLHSRGMFDYRYDADGVVDVRASGHAHRIELSRNEAESRLVWLTVPRENEAVYREALLDNPHASPLLTGPVDVFVEGSLVTTTNVPFVDKGGHIRVGLGVDERIRVARNTSIKEESAGLLGGRREVEHEIEIELSSSLGFEAAVTVLDRIPVTDEDHVDVELLTSKPTSVVYDQKDRKSPIEGGRQWEIRVPAGGTARVDFSYVVKLRSKDEIVGGNRRD